ncbi:MAG: hypothetical protein CM15mP65_02420 [Crocinitomicaceae bacterium]|nr:MAG: hypothetical protein CM15mP65_02420 [Crocinitomicaceae bacterium]
MDFRDSNHAETFNTENFSYVFQDMDLGIYPVCLAASNDFGCTTTYCSTIEFKDDFLIYVPNSFTQMEMVVMMNLDPF